MIDFTFIAMRDLQAIFRSSCLAFGAGGLILNIIWLVFLGWEVAITHLVIGAILCITIIGIPFGIQHFKFAKLGLMPFGAEIH